MKRYENLWYTFRWNDTWASFSKAFSQRCFIQTIWNPFSLKAYFWLFCITIFSIYVKKLVQLLFFKWLNLKLPSCCHKEDNLMLYLMVPWFNLWFGYLKQFAPQKNQSHVIKLIASSIFIIVGKSFLFKYAFFCSNAKKKHIKSSFNWDQYGISSSYCLAIRASRRNTVTATRRIDLHCLRILIFLWIGAEVKQLDLEQ